MAGATVDFAELRRAWLSNTEAEGRAWLAHIDRHSQRIIRLNAAVGRALSETDGAPVEWTDELHVPSFETGDLLFNVFAYTNWLAHIHLREKKHVSEVQSVEWLATFTSWPFEVCEAFWYCIRNPVMHTGRTSLFHDYDRKSIRRNEGSAVTGKLFADVHPNLTFDPLEFQPEEFKPTVETDGYFATESFFKPGGVQVNFYFPGVRRKLDRALEIVLNDMRVAKEDSLRKLIKVNEKIMMFRVAGPMSPAAGLDDQ